MHKTEAKVEIVPIFQTAKMWDRKQRRNKSPLCQMWLQIQSLHLANSQERQRNGTPLPRIGLRVELPGIRERKMERESERGFSEKGNFPSTSSACSKKGL